MNRILPLALMVLAAGASATAQEGYRHGRIGYLEPGVTLQRATEAGSEEATPNLPFLPGDRVWTDDAGRVEFQFLDRTFVRLDRRSKLDYATHEEGRTERIILRLWSGSLYLRSRNSDNPLFGIETPGGLVLTQERGVYRVDVDSGETRLSVHEGEATLEGGRRRVTVGAGERSYARRGDSPERPRPFDRGEADEFARWEGDRANREAWAGNSRRYLPKELDPYAGDFEAHGSWYYETEVGYVWRPYVGAGWRPYSFGRWAWTAYGWTWVPNETWGWAPSHYGRWGHSLALGWYWIPGNVWGPAWVSWGQGGDYVGWCPLGYRDRPVIVAETGS
ncbi:MAG TPA: FecR family protein, partial [Vicinamibacteria bacterium]|nr:FecR family protein [Vicinamibacteria bacterium]